MVKMKKIVAIGGGENGHENRPYETEKIDKELMCEYCKRYHITLKDFNSLLSMFRDELISDVKRYEKLVSVREQEKTISK